MEKISFSYKNCKFSLAKLKLLRKINIDNLKFNFVDFKFLF